jgi:hypothetical protein
LGPKGNAEFLVWLSIGGSAEFAHWVDELFPVEQT